MKLPAWIFRTRYQSTTLYYSKTLLKSFIVCSINHFCAPWTKNIAVRLRFLFTTLPVSIHESFTIWNVIRNLFSDAGFHKLRSTQHRGNLKLPIRSNTPFRNSDQGWCHWAFRFFFSIRWMFLQPSKLSSNRLKSWLNPFNVDQDSLKVF